MNKEERYGTWAKWGRRRKFVHFLARRFPRFLSILYQRKFLSGEHGRVDDWLSFSMGQKVTIVSSYLVVIKLLFFPFRISRFFCYLWCNCLHFSFSISLLHDHWKCKIWFDKISFHCLIISHVNLVNVQMLPYVIIWNNSSLSVSWIFFNGENDPFFTDGNWCSEFIACLLTNYELEANEFTVEGYLSASGKKRLKYNMCSHACTNVFSGILRMKLWSTR